MDRSDVDFRLRAVPAAVFVDLLREAGDAHTARALKQRLEARGVPKDMADAAWRRAQPGVRRHANVAFDEARNAYTWSDTPTPLPVFTPATALEHLLSPRAPGRVEAAEVIRAALLECQHRAALAVEIETLLLSGTDAAVVVERVRRLTHRAWAHAEPVG